VTLPTTGTHALHGGLLWRWTRVRDVAPGSASSPGVAVFGWDFAVDPSGPFYTAAPTDAPTAHLCRHEHSDPDAAALCADVRDHLRSRDTAALLARCAALPAPAGAMFLAHCGGYWTADHGGACGACGAPADVLPARVALRWDGPSARVWVTTQGVGVHHALDAAQAPRPPQTRVFDGSSAVVSDATLALRDALRERLVAAGWEVDAPAPRLRPPPQLRVVRREMEQLDLLGGAR
jgi:hypothetical protein